MLYEVITRVGVHREQVERPGERVAGRLVTREEEREQRSGGLSLGSQVDRSFEA